MDTLVKSKPEAKRKDKIIPVATAITGIAVDIIPRPIPEIITVAGPVFPASEIRCVGRYDWDV